MPIDTKIEGDPGSITSAATWVRDSLASTVTDTASQIYRARNSADAGWRGTAAEAFRDRMTQGARTTDEFAGTAKTMAQKFDDIAADLKRAQSDMENIRTQASSAGLAVNGEVIADPGPAPAAPGPKPTGDAATPQALQAHGDAVDAQNAHAKQVAAYEKAKADAKDVRTRWKGAVEGIAKEANSQGPKPWLTVGAVAGDTIAAAAGAKYSSFLLKGAQHYLDDAAQATRHVKAFGDVVLDHKNFYAQVDRAQASTRAAGALTDDAAKATSKAKLTGLKLGGALAIGGIAYDIANGKPVDQAVVSGGVGFGASVAAGAAVGTVIGGPVGTAVGAVVGAGVGVFTSGMVDSLYENGIGEVGQAIEDGGQAVVDTGKAIADGVGDAAGAVAGGVKDAWDAVF
ncbi:WXG100 family type VII secretion target [Amycolatopsis aidingensis]|uniref:WXG100 family type VII secretion target n=1 Tax=Amycolatopsis aidingensis TaxID=2842453 RepID=UPI001C0AFB6D|nr:WXG100 family type VII secretion target [Amycolatopsis aidingensis]